MELLEALTEIRKILENPAIIGVGSALIGGFFARHASIKAHELSERRSRKEALLSSRNSLLLISTELEAAWGLYNAEYSGTLMALPEGEPHMYNLAIGADSFTIYESTSSCLIDFDPSLASAIVRTYMRIKGLVAMIETNNRYLELVSEAGRKRLVEMTRVFLENNPDATLDQVDIHSFSYEEWLVLEAKIVGMGSYADALKKLTIELGGTYPLLMSGIKAAVNSMDEKIANIDIS